MNIIDYCSDKNIYLYGAGDIANVLCQFLQITKKNIRGFVVSDEKEKIKKEIDGIPVLYLSELLEKYDSEIDKIIVAVSEKFQEEIISNLNQVGITSYYVPCKQDVKWNEEKIRNIGILDTTVSDENHGNEIIMQAVHNNIDSLFTNDFVIRFPYWDDFLKNTLKNMQLCNYLFLGGGNSLNSEMDKFKYLGVNEKNIDVIEHKVVLLGVGWWQYEKAPNAYTERLIKRVLNENVLHSVRDSYTEKMLKSIGIKNVVNTGCPTIWRLNQEFCKKIPKRKAKDAIVMFTPRKEKEIDRYIIDIVRKNYEKVYFWVQGPEDYSYIKSMCAEAILIPPQLEELENFLEKHQDIDYVGTRLHGGIKCIQNKKRAIIIAIDNRAQEMKKDFNLPVVLFEELDCLGNIINTEKETRICINEDKINQWLGQFIKEEKIE